MAKKQFKDPFASIRATQERELKRLLEQASKPIAAPPAPSMAGFRQLEAESMNMPIPEYKPPSQAGAIKRSLGALGLGLLEGTEKLREKYSADKLLAERISPELDMIRPKYTPLITPEQSKQYEENIGLQGTLGEGIWRGIGTETPAIALSYGAIGAGTKVPKIAKALTGAGKWTETGRRGVAAGALYTPIAEEKPELKDYLENMALFGAGDVAFMGAIHGIGKGIGKGAEALKGFKRPRDTPEPEATLDFLTGESPAPVRQQPDYVPPPRVAPDFTSTPYGGVYRGGPRTELPGAPESLALPAGKDYLALPAGEKLTSLPRPGEVVNFDLPTPYETLTALERQRPRALTPGEQPPMLPEGYYPNWEFGNRPEADFAVDYGGGAMAKGVDYPPARIPGVDYGGDISLRNKQRVLVDIDKPIPRSDIGDPAYLAGLEKQYGDFVAEEVARMKDELGGVVNVPERNMRVSQNPAWYREFWQKHLRAPREGEWRDLAIKNLMEGNPETGEPANDEFLAIMSELSRGQKLPEEWHGLQRTIRDLEGSKSEYVLDNAQRQEIIEREHARRKQNDYDVFDDYVEHFPHESEFLDNFSHLYYKKPYYNLTPAEKLDIDSLAKEYWKGEGYYGIDSPDAFYGKEYDDALYKFGGGKEEQPSDIDSLLADMRTEQAKAEPYGLERDMGRLSEAENAYRGRMEDKADFGMRDSVLYEGQPKFKRNLTPEQQQDLEVLKVVAEQRKIGPFTINKVDLAPEAMERPDFKAAGEIADKLGLRLVTFKGKGARGAQHGRTLYINEGITDPVDYVFLHEVTHSMQDFQSQHYGRLFDLSLEHLADAEGIDRHYIEQGYARADRPHEFAADVFAEAMSTPGFFARVAERAPELVKPLLEAIDRLIANVKGMITADDTIIPYMRDWEVLRQRIRDEVAMPYFKDAMGEKQFVDTFGHKWQDPAAKAKAETVPEVVNNVDTPEFRKWFGDSKVVDESGKPLVVYHGTKGTFNTFKSQYRGTTTGSDSSMLGIFFADAKNVAETYANEALPPKARREYVNYQKNMELFKETGDNIYEENARYHLNEYIRIKTYGKPGKNRIIEGYLNIRNPYIYEANGANGYDIGITEIINKAKKDGHDGVVIKDIYDPAQEIGNGISNHYVVFSPTQIKSVYNRGTWDPANPDIRFKLGEGDKSIVDDFTAMVQYGVKQIPKGNFDHFSKLIQKQFPDELAGYSPEITQRLMKQIWEHSRKLRDAGETVVTLQGKQYPIKRGEVAGEARVRDSEQVPGDIGEVDTRRHIVSKTQREPIIAKETTKMVYTKAVDDLYRIDEMDKFVARTTGKHLPAEDKAYLLAINSREATGAARAILEENLVDAQGNIIGKSFKEVLSNIPKGKEQEFRDYLVLRNAISWMEQGKKVYPKEWGMTPEKAMQRLAAYDQQIPELKQVADEYVNWHRDMAKSWLVDTGILTPEMWEAFLQAHPHYTPFQRQMKPIETTPGQGKARRGFANQTNPTKKAEGSERPIIDPIESTIEQVDRYIKTAKRNEVMQAVIRNLEKAPEELEGFAEIIPDKKMDMLDDVNAILNRDGIDGVINYLEEPFEQMISRKGKSEQPLDKPNIVRAFANGERVHVKVNDPVLLDSLTALSDTGRNAIVETFRTATRLMKVLTTGGNPIFAARNISRDVPMAYVASETLSKAPVVREAQFAWGMVDALARILTNEKWHPDKFYREYKAMGGGSHTASVAADRNILAESKSRVMPGYWSPKNNNPLTYMGKGAKAGFQGIERFTSTVEALPRLPEYIRTVKKGGNDYASKLEGLHASQDVTVNFSRHGDISKDADAFIPYFNAAVQGIEKIARMWGSDPLGATYRSLVAVTIPTIGLYLWNKDNPNYHKLSSIIRDNYYCIPIQGGEKFIKVAKPREIGVVFSDLPERALRKWEADDPEGFYQFSEAWINNFVPPMRPIVMPIADVMRNRDFAERPIVPGYMEGLSPELQYDEKTSAAAKAIGNAFKLSPKQIDYLFRSYTGVIGELGIPAMAQGQGQNAGQRVGEVLKRTFTADPLYSNDITNKFYEQKERYDTAAKDFKNTGNRGEYFDPARQRYFSRQADRISNIRKEIRKVNADPDLSYEEKEERTRRMQANMLEIAQGAVGDRFSPRIAR